MFDSIMRRLSAANGTWACETKGFSDNSVAWLRGGDRTPTLAAACDPRIKHRFRVAGIDLMLCALRGAKRNYGDFEQTYPTLCSKVNYLGLYIFGASWTG